MPARHHAVHVATTTRTYKDRVYRTHLLRRSYREAGTVKHETLGNISHLPLPLIDLLRRSLQGETFVPVEQAFRLVNPRLHGPVEAVKTAMSRLGVAALLDSKPCKERALVCALVAARIIAPDTKLATSRWWHTTTVPEEFAIGEADEDDLYAAMDWLVARQERIQKKLAQRHLHEGGLVLYDLTSSYFEGTTCPLARLGHNRDGQKGKLQVNYGVLTDRRGCPVAVTVHPGNVADPATLLPQVCQVRERFGLQDMVLVGDRGMLAQTKIDALRAHDGLRWITALKSGAVRRLVEDRSIQPGLFDQRNLASFTHPAYPGERLVACRNPALAAQRAWKREALLSATEQKLDHIRSMVARGRLKGRETIGVRVGKDINRYQVAKHFALDIGDRTFSWRRQQEAIAREAALDGLYIIRTSVPEAEMEAPECVTHYKALARVERAFRTLKSLDLRVRPIHHRLADRVRAHIFLCLLAYYVEWHMREAWRNLLFHDPKPDAPRDPVAPAQRSPAAQRKVANRRLDDGTPAHSFTTLMKEFAPITRSTCEMNPGTDHVTRFDVVPETSSLHRRALALLKQIHV